ncbi:MAG: hypothetical protein ABSB71_13345 [Candidatus Bathyarchaeia archaeon]|jgi:hypothetical protein
MSGKEVEVEEIELVNPDGSIKQLRTDPNGNLQVAIASPGVLNNLAQNQILSDATPFAGANVAAIKAKTDLLPADTATQLDTNIPAVKAKTDLIPAGLVALLYAAAGGPYALSDVVLFSHDAETSHDTPTYVKVKEINVGYLSGTIRTAFSLKAPAEGHWVVGRIYKNGVAMGNECGQSGTDYYEYVQDLAFAKNDLLQLYVLNSDAGYPGLVKNFRVKGTFLIPQMPAVTL